MAALRVAARRLVGGGGRTPAVAVGETQHRLFPRLFQVDRARSTTSSAAAANRNAAAAKKLIFAPAKQDLDADGREILLKEIHNRREQLYDLTETVEAMYDIPGRAGREVARLRQDLAAQVEPRSNDMVWRIVRGKGIFERYGGFAAFMFTFYVLTGMARGSIVELDPEEKQWIKKRRNEASKRRSGHNVSLK
uniref:Uncharacterized protein n=1 Tax=Avena sativa TaxID=4498 RepID=A0ACD5TDB0_AVESA